MKQKFFVLFFLVSIFICFTNATTPRHKTVNVTNLSLSKGANGDIYNPVTFVFSYSRTFYYRGCQVTANFSVSVTIEMTTQTVTGVSATLTSGSISCPPTNISRASISFTYSGSHVNGVDFSSEVSDWDEAMNSKDTEILADVNADIDSVLN